MKKLIVAPLTLVAILAFVSSAQADSLSYRTSGLKASASFALDGNLGGLAGGIPETGAYPTADMPRAFAVHSGIRASQSAAGRLANSRVLAANSGQLFDNLLGQGNSVNGILEGSGALVDMSGNRLELLFGGSGSDSAAGSGHDYAAGKNIAHANTETSRGSGYLVTGAATLMATPEPGSLFLLGTGLLCMALVLFRNAPKRSAVAQK